MKVISQQYGKARVRVMKILKSGEVHRIKELTVQAMLDGPAYDRSYKEADNSMVVPTDTVKNTIQCFAFDFLEDETEPFVERLADHFLGKYEQVKRVTIRTSERVWGRIEMEGGGHPHTFQHVAPATPSVCFHRDENEAELESGIENMVILKSTEAGFAGFPRCEFTTLPETYERIVATSLSSSWTWQGVPQSYRHANQAILEAFFRAFATRFSKSVQQNLWDMGVAALEAVPEISKITLRAPNLHCNLIDLSAFGRNNQHTLFVPTDEPHGQIEVTIGR